MTDYIQIYKEVCAVTEEPVHFIHMSLSVVTNILRALKVNPDGIRVDIGNHRVVDVVSSCDSKVCIIYDLHNGDVDICGESELALESAAWLENEVARYVRILEEVALSLGVCDADFCSKLHLLKISSRESFIYDMTQLGYTVHGTATYTRNSQVMKVYNAECQVNIAVNDAQDYIVWAAREDDNQIIKNIVAYYCEKRSVDDSKKQAYRLLASGHTGKVLDALEKLYHIDYKDVLKYVVEH